jgi:hypothetical protein
VVCFSGALQLKMNISISRNGVVFIVVNGLNNAGLKLLIKIGFGNY